jgi:hypothetical protein
MKPESNEGRTLRDIELEVLAEGREWTRRRLEQRLQEEADRQGGVFPPQREEGSSSAQANDGATNRSRARKTKGMAGRGSSR